MNVAYYLFLVLLPCSLILQFLYYLTRSVGGVSNSGIFKMLYYFRLNYISIYFVSSNKWLVVCTKHN